MNDWSRAVSAHQADASASSFETVTGNRGLQIEEALIFEQDSPGHCGVDLPEPAPFRNRLGGLERQGMIGLPGSASRRWCATSPASRKRTTRSIPGSTRSARAR